MQNPTARASARRSPSRAAARRTRWTRGAAESSRSRSTPPTARIPVASARPGRRSSRSTATATCTSTQPRGRSSATATSSARDHERHATRPGSPTAAACAHVSRLPSAELAAEWDLAVDDCSPAPAPRAAPATSRGLRHPRVAAIPQLATPRASARYTTTATLPAAVGRLPGPRHGRRRVPRRGQRPRVPSDQLSSASSRPACARAPTGSRSRSHDAPQPPARDASGRVRRPGQAGLRADRAREARPVRRHARALIMLASDGRDPPAAALLPRGGRAGLGLGRG